MLRNVYNFDKKEPSSFWFVIKDSFGGLEELSAKLRRKIGKANRTYDIKRITVTELLDKFYPVYQKAMLHYAVKAVPQDETAWRNGVVNNDRSHDKQYWGVHEKQTQTPVAFAINTVGSDYCEYNTLKCDPAFQHNSSYPYYGLLYEMNRYYLDESKLRYVNDGARTITEHSGVQDFLEHNFNFRKAYCDLRIYYKWHIGMAVKLLYPFRNIITNRRVVALLRQEAMVRGEY